MAALSAEIPLSTIAVLKRLFIKTFGNDPFTTLAAIREARAELSFDYECGSFDDQDSNKVHFLRITDTDTVLQKTVINLSNSGELEHLCCYAQDELRLLVTLDKGGCSTKLVLQVLNAKRRHSTSTARLLGFFRGGEDSSSNVEKVFGPIIASYNTAKNVHKLQLPAPAAPTQQFSPTAQPAKQISVMKHLQSLGITASGTGRISAECKHCNRVATDQRASRPSASHVTQCKIVAGGDWLSEATLLGLTGPKGADTSATSAWRNSPALSKVSLIPQFCFQGTCRTNQKLTRLPSAHLKTLRKTTWHLLQLEVTKARQLISTTALIPPCFLRTVL